MSELNLLDRMELNTTMLVDSYNRSRTLGFGPAIIAKAVSKKADKGGAQNWRKSCLARRVHQDALDQRVASITIYFLRYFTDMINNEIFSPPFCKHRQFVDILFPVVPPASAPSPQDNSLAKGFPENS